MTSLFPFFAAKKETKKLFKRLALQMFEKEPTGDTLI